MFRWQNRKNNSNRIVFSEDSNIAFFSAFDRGGHVDVESNHQEKKYPRVLKNELIRDRWVNSNKFHRLSHSDSLHGG